MIKKILSAFLAGKLTKEQAIKALMENGVEKNKAIGMLQQLMQNSPPPRPETIGQPNMPTERIAPIGAARLPSKPSALRRK